MATFPDSFTELGGDPVDPVPVGDSFEEYDESQRLDSLVEDSDTAKDVVDDVFESEPSGYVNGNQEFGGSDGPILPPSMEMEPEEGYALREWRRENAIRLEEKEKKEKELLSQIIEEAETYKVEFHKKREATCEANKVSNREKEKIFLANHEKFHAEADKNYWKAIAELIPNEVPAIEKRGKKDKEKKPSIVVVQGPKPGKPTDRTRMRQIIIKLKHSTPSHLKHSPAPTPAKDASVAAAPVAAAPEAVVSA